MQERRRKGCRRGGGGGAGEEEERQEKRRKGCRTESYKTSLWGGEPEGRSFRAIIPAAEHRVQVLGGGQIFGLAVFSLTPLLHPPPPPLLHQ
jgi:hypothetical protein